MKLDEFVKSPLGPVFVIPACLRVATSAKTGKSRNPGFPMKIRTGVTI
jgi:hypothetical protein